MNWPALPFSWPYLVTHAVEQTWDHWEDCRPQRLQVIRQKSDVPLEKANSTAMDEDHTLTKTQQLIHKFIS